MCLFFVLIQYDRICFCSADSYFFIDLCHINVYEFKQLYILALLISSYVFCPIINHIFFGIIFTICFLKLILDHKIGSICGTVVLLCYLFWG